MPDYIKREKAWRKVNRAKNIEEALDLIDKLPAEKVREVSSELNKIKTRFGDVYIESLISPEEEERIKIFDSNEKYIDYFPFDYIQDNADQKGITLEEEYSHQVQRLRTAISIEELVARITEDIEMISQNPFEIAKALDVDFEDEKRILYEVESNEYVNQIGSYYILMED
jgi:hypothetical protein